MNNVKFEFVRGDTYQRNIKISGFNHEITNVYFTVKKSDKDKDYVLQKTLNHGITLIEDDDVKVYGLTINATDTDDFDVDKEYPFDIELVSNTIKRTIITGDLILSSDITRTFNE